MSFKTNDPVTELRAKARDMFPHNDDLARSTYHWNAADEIERLQSLLKFILGGIERGKIKDASLVVRGQEDLDTLSARIRRALPGEGCKK